MLFLIRWFWRGYWLYLLFLFCRLVYPWQAEGVEEWIDAGLMLPSLLGLYGFAFQKNLLKKPLWKLYFVTLLTWDFYYHFLLQGLKRQCPPSPEALILLVTLAPMYLALFQYAFLAKEEPNDEKSV